LNRSPAGAPSSVRTACLRLAGGFTWRRTTEFSWVLAGQAAGLVGSIGLTKVLTSQLGTEEYGRFALGLTVAVLLNQFLFGPITVAGVRYFSPYRDSARLQPFMRALWRLTAVTAAMVFVAALIALPIVFRHYGGEWAALIGLAAVYGVVQNVFGLFNGLDAAARNRGRVAVHQALDPALRLAVSALALWFLSRSAWAAMLGVSVAMCLVMTSQVALFRRSIMPYRCVVNQETSATTRNLLGYAKYFVVAGVFTSLQLSSDRWALKLYLNDSAVGVYAAAYQLASVPSVVLAGCVAQFFSPIVFQRAQDGTSVASLHHARQAIVIGALVLGALVAVSTLAAAVLGEPLIVLFTSKAYRASGPYIAPLVLGLGLLQIGHMLSLVALSSNRLKGHLVVRVIHGLVATTLNIWATRYFGVPGLCVALIVGSAVYVALVLFNNARITRSLTLPAVGQFQLDWPT
jgi:O-antigen/teichoic acid export membrane protein